MADDDEARDAALIDSWSVNADRWTAAVRSGAIASRRLVTDAAMVDAVSRRRPATVLDLGCGEGWLARALTAGGSSVVGVDVSPALVAVARAEGGGTFHVGSYAEIIATPDRFGRDFAAVVANFALLDEGVAPLLAALARIVCPGGVLVIQTLHPGTMPPPYDDGWRVETFDGFGEVEGWQAMPWYFRTTASWLNVITKAWRIVEVEEPIDPRTGRPASLLIVAAVA